jgi:peptide methionine sulfoxide reductase MsrA
VTAGYINLSTKCENPKGEALETSTECYANRLQCSTEHNATDLQKVTYRICSFGSRSHAGCYKMIYNEKVVNLDKMLQTYDTTMSNNKTKAMVMQGRNIRTATIAIDAKII